MPLPEQFDLNEWVVLIGLVVYYTIVFLLPRRLPVSLILLLMVFTIVLARMFDVLLSSRLTDFYDIMDTRKYDLFDLFLYLYYAPFVYFFVYLYEKLQIKGYKVWFYIVVCSIFSTLFEGFHVLTHVFTYKHWKLYYSFPVYLFVQLVTLMFYNFLITVYQREKKANG